MVNPARMEVHIAAESFQDLYFSCLVTFTSFLFLVAYTEME